MQNHILCVFSSLPRRVHDPKVRPSQPHLREGECPGRSPLLTEQENHPGGPHHGKRILRHIHEEAIPKGSSGYIKNLIFKPG